MGRNRKQSRLLNRSRLLTRVILLCFIVIGSQFAIIPAFLASSISHAAPSTKALVRTTSSYNNMLQQSDLPTPTDVVPTVTVPVPTDVVPTVTVPVPTDVVPTVTVPVPTDVVPTVTVPVPTDVVPTVTVPVPTDVVPTVTVPVPTDVVPTVTVPVPTDVVPTVTVPVPTDVVPTVTVPVPTDVIPTVTVPVPTDVVPTVTVPVPTVTAIPTLAPDLAISQIINGGTSFQVGQTVVDKLLFNTGSASGNLPIVTPNSIIANAIIPVGLSNITVTGSNWVIQTTSLVSPATVTAVYTGVYPVPAGTLLPPLTLTGLLNDAAVPTLSITSAVITPGDINLVNNTITTVLSVVEPPTPTAIPVTPTPTTAPVTPTAVPPMLNLDEIDQGVTTLQVGQTFVNDLLVSTASNAGPVVTPNSVFITDVISTGVSDLQVVGTNWVINSSSPISPSLISATYVGSYPIAPGSILPPLELSGVLNQSAVPFVTNNAYLSSLTDSIFKNNIVNTVVSVISSPSPSIRSSFSRSSALAEARKRTVQRSAHRPVK